MAEDRAHNPSRKPVLNKERSGSVMHGGFGRKPTITDVHEAVMGNHIDAEQGSNLNAKYQPDAYKVNKSGDRPAHNPWLQNQHVYNSMVAERKKRNLKKGGA